MTKGVILLCFGDVAYAKMAFNMGLSIKRTSPGIEVTLVHDGKGINTLSPHFHFVFDKMILIDNEDMYEDDSFSPGKAKTRINKYLQYDHNIYLDIDGAVIKDLNPLFDTCMEQKECYKSQVVGFHTIDKGRDFAAMQWAWADDIWKRYKLKSDALMPAINSSFAYMRKGKELDNLFTQVQKNLDNPIPINELRTQWGKTQPDELYMNIGLAQTGIDALIANPDGSWHHPVFFTTSIVRNFSIIQENYYVVGLYGGVGFTHSTLMQYYDRLMRKYCKEIGMEHYFKAHLFMQKKHANKRGLK